MKARSDVGLPITAVQRLHQQDRRPFATRLVGDKPLEVGNDAGVAAERHQRPGPLLDRHQPELLQPGRLRKRPPLGGEFAICRAVPQRQCAVVHRDRPFAVHSLGVIDECGELVGVHRGFIAAQRVRRAKGDDRVGAQRGPEARDVCVDRTSGTR